MFSIIANFRKSLANQSSMNVLTPPIQLPRDLTEKAMAISRGWIFMGNPPKTALRLAALCRQGRQTQSKRLPRSLWYKPTGSDNYRVIYADLSIREARPDELPPGEPVKPDWPAVAN